MKIKVETDNHSLDKFRVNIPLMNMVEFSEAWECPLGIYYPNLSHNLT